MFCKFSRARSIRLCIWLEQKPWIKAKWAEAETGRRAKFYSLTAAGRARLEKEAANWNRLSAAIDLVVETT